MKLKRFKVNVALSFQSEIDSDLLGIYEGDLSPGVKVITNNYVNKKLLDQIVRQQIADQILNPSSSLDKIGVKLEYIGEKVI